MFNKRRLLLFLALFCSAAFAQLSQAQTVELKVGGTGNALGIARLLTEAFCKSHPGIKIVMLNSIGSSGAINGTLKGGVDIGLSARPLSEEEKQAGISMREFARTPTIFAVNASNSAKSVSIQDIANIYSGKLTHWPDGAVIRPVLRQPGDDNTKQIKALSPEIAQALLVADERQGLPFAVTDQEAAEKIESSKGGFGVTTLALTLSEKRELKGLALSGVEPSLENMVAGRYPMTKHFYIILPKAPKPEALEFVKFAASPDGAAILKENGAVLP